MPTYTEFLDAVPRTAEFVYVLVSEYSPQLVKIGRTDRAPLERMAELNRQTGLPNDHWRLAFAVGTRMSRTLENAIHMRFREFDRGGEVFRIDIATVIQEIAKHEVIAVFNPYEHASVEFVSGLRPTSEQHGKVFSSTARYEGHCSVCGADFSVTLTRYESGARCPRCLAINSTSGFGGIGERY